MMEFMHDDFPEPVAPEMRMCGISARLDHDGPAGDVPSHRHLERVRRRAGLLGLEDVAQGDELTVAVRYLDADGRLARDGREDADVG